MKQHDVSQIVSCLFGVIYSHIVHVIIVVLDTSDTEFVFLFYKFDTRAYAFA